MEEEANQLYQRPQMMGHARDGEAKICEKLSLTEINAGQKLKKVIAAIAVFRRYCKGNTNNHSFQRSGNIFITTQDTFCGNYHHDYAQFMS